MSSSMATILTTVLLVNALIFTRLPLSLSQLETYDEICTAGYTTVWQRFQVVPGDNFTTVYVAGVNIICHCKLELNQMTSVFHTVSRDCVVLGPKLDSTICNVDAANNINAECKPVSTDQNNKIMLQYGDWLIVCGNLHQGECELISRTHLIERVLPDRSMEYKVASNLPSAPTVGVLDFVANKSSLASSSKWDSDMLLFVGATFTPRNLLTGQVAHRVLGFYQLPADFDPKKLFLAGNSVEEVRAGRQFALALQPSQQQSPPYYVAALTHGQYIYLFSTQLVNYTGLCGETHRLKYQTRVTRVCKNDVTFRSLLELPLYCSSDNNSNHYTKLTAASMESNLTNIVDTIQEGTDSFLLLMRSDYSNRSALCYVTLPRLNARFDKLKQECINNSLTHNAFSCIYDSNGNYHGNQTCSETTGFDEDNWSKGSSNCTSNWVLRAVTNDLFQITAVYSTESLLTSYWLGRTGEGVPLGIFGTESGVVIIVAYDPKLYGTQTNNVTNSKILQIERSGNTLALSNSFFILSQGGLFAIQGTCGDLTQCEACTSNPFCGWCTLDERCTASDECHTTWLNRFLSHDKKNVCPNVTELTPRSFSVRENIRFIMEIENVEFYRNVTGQWRCALSFLLNSTCTSLSNCSHYVSNTNIAPVSRNNSGTVMCSLPPLEQYKISLALNSRPLVHTFLDHEFGSSLSKSVKIGEPIEVEAYDCTTLDSCQACTSFRFRCYWCLYENRCTCNNSSCAYNVGKELQTLCPQVACMKPHRLLDSGDCSETVEISAGNDAVIELIGTFVPETDDCYYKCTLNSSQQVFNLLDTTQINTSTLLCDLSRFELLAPYKVFSLILRWKCNSPNIFVPFAPGSSSNLKIYNCSLFFDCTSCVPNGPCSWCDGLCVSATTCAKPSDKCPDPFVRSISPTSATIEGGTVVTIEGHDLGNDVAHSDGTFSITLADVECRIQAAVNTRLVCKVESSGSEARSGPLKITKHGVDHVFDDLLFYFLNPQIKSVEPLWASRLDNANVTITGDDLVAGKKQRVTIGPYDCKQIEPWTRTAIQCRLSRLEDSATVPDFALKVVIHYDTTNRTANANFIMFDYPSFTSSLSPGGCIHSGGVEQHISGKHFSVNSVQMITSFVVGNRSYEMSTRCVAEQSTDLRCKCAAVDWSSIVAENSRSEVQVRTGSLSGLDTGMSNVEEVVRDPSWGQFEGRVKFAFNDYILDGFSIEYSADPQFTTEAQRTVDTGDVVRIPIYGQRLNASKLMDYYKIVLKDSMVCELDVNGYQNNQLVCIVKTWSKDDFTTYWVNVSLGHLSVTPFEIARQIPPNTPEDALITILISASIFFVLVFVVSVAVFYRVFRRVKRKYKHTLNQLDGFESGIRNEAKQAFTELQFDMTAFTDEFRDQLNLKRRLPYWQVDRYMFKILFPKRSLEHPLLRHYTTSTSGNQSPSDHQFDCWTLKSFPDSALRLFETMIKDRKFLMFFIRTLEAQPSFNASDRCDFASLLFIAILHNGDYTIVILKHLVEHAIAKAISHNTHRFLFRQSESVAEKFVANWLSFCFYSNLTAEAGRALFCLYSALKLQISKGPVDFFTESAKYTLAEQNLLRQNVKGGEPITILVDIPFETRELLGLRPDSNLYVYAGSPSEFDGNGKRPQGSATGSAIRYGMERSNTGDKSLDIACSPASYPLTEIQTPPVKQMRLETDSDLDTWRPGIENDLENDDEDEDLSGPIVERLPKEKQEEKLQQSDPQDNHLTASFFGHARVSSAVYANQESQKQYVVVRVLKCDCITQVKQKILDTVYRFKHQSDRHSVDEFELLRTDTLSEMRSQISNLLQDEDGTSEFVNGWRRINTIEHYGIALNTPIIFRKKEKEKSSATVQRGDSKAGPRLQKYSTEVQPNGNLQKSSMSMPPSPGGSCGTTTSSKMRMPFWRSRAVNGSTERLTQHRSAPSASITTATRSRKLFHLEKPQSDVKQLDRQRLILEVCLPRMMVMKTPLQKFIDDALSAIVKSTEESKAVKFLFDLLVDEAHKKKVHEPSIHSSWKTNVLMLRFWVNVLHNPDFVFDVHKSGLIDANLGVISQAVIDSCSLSPQVITKDTPASRLLFARDVPRYRSQLTSAYQNINKREPVTDQDISSFLAEVINEHNLNFNVDVAIKELMVYAHRYRAELIKALETETKIKELYCTKFRDVMTLLERLSDRSEV